MRHGLALLAFALALVCGCTSGLNMRGKATDAGTIGQTSRQEPFAEIDPKVMDAWQKAGANYGLIQRSTAGTPNFEWINRVKWERIGLPTFVLAGPPEDLTELPEPQVPFGIYVIQSQNKVNNRRFTHLPRFKNLRVLMISMAWADREGWEHIADIPGLRTLFIGSASGLDGPTLARICRHPGLEELYLFQNPRIGDNEMEILAGMSKLHTLYLKEQGFGDAGVKKLAGMKKIRNLGLHGYHVTDDGLKHLAAMPLETLSLDGMKDLTDTSLQTLAEQHDLRRLSLVGCRKITDDGMKHVSRMKNLEELNVCGTQVTGAGLAPLAGLHNLRRLNFRDQKITDEAVDNLKRIKSLQWVNARVSEEQAESLRQAIPGLQIEGIRR